MTKPPEKSVSKHRLAEDAINLARIGDLDAAAQAFAEAIARDSRNFDLWFNFAVLQEERGEIDRAAELLTVVLARKPTYPNAAARLSRLLARFQLDDAGGLDPAGLRAALVAQNVARQPIVDVAVAWLASRQPDLSLALSSIESGRLAECDIWDFLLAERIAEGLKHDLLLAALRNAIVKHAGLERVLTGVRAGLLLNCPATRFEDRALTDLALALVVQGWNNDHAWAETPAESEMLDALVIDRAALLAGEREAMRRFLCVAMYRPLADLVTPPLSAGEAHRLKPRSLRETFEPQITAAARQQAASLTIPSLRPLTDATSLKVAGQYEVAPYPRWQSLHVSTPGALTRTIKERFTDRPLPWLDRPFDVLIAGCGTGQQALQSANAYGPSAHLTALDLSRASLGYASDMAAHLKVGNVSFVQGDILDAALLDRSFDIIECVGVLHHMADWRAGWQALLQRLKPTGLMYVGLYSALSRQNLKTLRQDPQYPGPGCSNSSARAYRRDLLMREDTAAGGELKVSRDFYALNAFRDLVLHESEAHVTIEEITEFLDRNQLAFRGFTVETAVLHDFASAFPASGRPGSLADWAAFERDHPRTFDAMYRFWVERRN